MRVKGLWYPAKPVQGGKSQLAEKRRQRAAELGLVVRKGGPEATMAGATLRRRHGGLAVTKGANGERQAALMRLAKRIKREERGEQRQLAQGREAKRIALISYARWGPGSSFRPGGECAYVGCDCEGSLPDHFDLCVQRCHCRGQLHPLPNDRSPMARGRR
jgi:hypothetical protein